jgi:tetratricopeptide (TPR) repeat protein
MKARSNFLQRATVGAVFYLLGLSSGAALADTSQMISDAISHYDVGDYDKAVSLLQQVLEQEPDNGYAAYELALTYATIDDLKSCTSTAKKYRRKLRKDEEQAEILPQLAMLEASCHSKAGASRKALKVFREALEDHPDNYGLNFNIAITLIQDDQFEQGIVHLERAILADPFHPSPYYVIGTAYRGVGSIVRSQLAYLTFLQREFNTQRSLIAAQSVIDLMYADVERAEEGVSIYSDLGSSEEGSDPEGLIRFLMAGTAATTFTDDGIQEPLCDTGAQLLETFISGSVQFFDKYGSDDFLTEYLLPGVEGIYAAELSEPFSYFVMSAAGVEGADDWLAENTQAVDELVQHFQMTTGDD